MTDQPDIIADYTALIVALKARIDKLAISQTLIDDLAGWATGYAGKILGPSEVKRMGSDSLFTLLETLGLGLQLVENPAALRKMERRYERRAEWTRRTGILRRPISPAVRAAAVHQHMAEIGAIGGKSRARCVAARSAQNAARFRWAKARNGNGNGRSR